MIRKFASWNAKSKRAAANRWDKYPKCMTVLFAVNVGLRAYNTYQKERSRTRVQTP